MVSKQTAYATGPVGSFWINSRFRGLAATIERVRVDHHVEELLAHGADPLHFMSMFGVSTNPPARCAAAVAAVLSANLDLT